MIYLNICFIYSYKFFHYFVYDSYISKCELKVQRNHKLHPQKWPYSENTYLDFHLEGCQSRLY